MALAQYHYMVDYFFPDEARFDGVREESHRIVAADDADAVREGKVCSIGARPDFPRPPAPLAYFRVRKVGRKLNEVIFDSRDSSA